MSTPRDDRDSDYRDVALVVVGAVLISLKGILAKLLYREGVSVEALVLLRGWIALPIIWSWALYREGARSIVSVPANLMVGALLAGVACYYLGSWLDFVALTMIDASLERVLLFSYPVMVVVARAFMQRRWPSRRVIAAVTLTYFGIVCAVGGLERGMWQANGFGAVLVLAAAAGFAYYVIANERFAQIAPSSAFIVYASLGAAVGLAIHFGFFGEFKDLVLSTRAWALLLLMTVFTNVLPLFLFSASIRRIGAQHASIISSIGPLATIGLAVVVLGETMRPVQLAGVVLIITGIVILEARWRGTPETI